LANSGCEEIYAPSKAGEQRRSCLDNFKVKKELNWEPEYNLEKGLEKTIRWFKENEY